MKLQETVLCALGPSHPASGSGHLALHDLTTGTNLATYKQTSSFVHATAVVESQQSQGGFLLSAQADKPILNVYHFQKDQLAQRIVLPEKICCLASDNRGILCAAGTTNGRIYLWEVASGIMLNSWEAHFRRVHVLKFTNDGAALVSASEDSAVSVWSVANLVDIQVQHEIPTPYCNLSDHTLPVLDVTCGSGLFPNCRFVTCSQDHSVKLWDLSSPSRPLLTTFTFPHSIQMVTMDSAQRVIFAAASGGEIYRINLFKQVSERSNRGVEAVSGGIFRTSEDKQPEIVVGQTISSMTISFTSSHLLVGTSSGAIHIYDIESHQLLRSISTHKDKGLSVVYLQCMLKPIDLQGHATIGDGGPSAKEPIPLRPVVPLQRMRDLKARDVHEVSMMILPSSPEAKTSASEDSELLAGQAYFLGLSSATHQTSNAAVNSRVTELEAEIARLRADLGKAKGINDSMWEMVVNAVLPKSSGEESEGTPPEADFMVIDEAPKAKPGPSDGRKRARK
ncbi:pre-rRNA-processing protein IPI3 [Ceratobasidium sp. AG-Ba]|nr:pre-rRNA-processing protein IPI3 [Ceratobasidium sp. AG-Ba]